MCACVYMGIYMYSYGEGSASMSKESDRFWNITSTTDPMNPREASGHRPFDLTLGMRSHCWNLQ